MKTTDAATTRTAVDTTGRFKSDLAAIPGLPGMYVSVGAAQGASGSSYTVDSGDNWVLLDQDIQYISTEFLDGNTGWAGSFSMNSTMGGIYKWKGLMSVMVSNLPICAGDSLNVNVNVIGSLNSGNTFTVELSNAVGDFSNPTVIGTLLNNVSSVVHCFIPLSIPSGTGYRVRAISDDPSNTTGDNGFNLTINNKPIVNAGSDITICYAVDLNLNANVMFYDSLSWSTSGTGLFNNPSIVNPVYTPSLADSAAGAIMLYLTAYSDCGFTVDTLNLTLSTTAVANAGIDVSICEGDSATLLANGGSSYLWNTDPTLCCLAIANPIATPTVTTTYIVTATSLCGTASDSVVVTVNSKPLALISTNDPVSFCDGGNATLVANYDPTFVYNWFLDGSATTVDDTLYVAEVTGEYTVLVTNSNMCSQISNSINIIANPLPIGTISASDTTAFCDGDSIILSVSTSSANDYSWFKDGVLITGNDNNPLTVNTSGNYVALILDSAGCSSNSPTVGVTVNPIPPTPTITVNNGILFSSALNGNQWYLEGNIIAGAVQRPYTPTVTGNYSVQVTSPEGCKSDMSIPYYITVGIDEISNELNISIYPNPNAGILNIAVSFDNITDVNVEITDALGQLVLNTNLNGNINSKRIDISHLTDGMYFVKLTYDTKSVMGKIVLQR